MVKIRVFFKYFISVYLKIYNIVSNVCKNDIDLFFFVMKEYSLNNTTQTILEFSKYVL